MKKVFGLLLSVSLLLGIISYSVAEGSETFTNGDYQYHLLENKTVEITKYS